MFFIKKLITSAVLPPGIVIIIFAIIGVCAKRKAVTILSLICALMLYALSIEPVKDFIFLPLENKAKAITPLLHIANIKNSNGNNNQNVYSKEIDAIVILGGGVYENGNFTEDSANRLLAGYFLYTLINKPVILSGGSADFNIQESYTMYSVLRHLQVPQKDIIIESKSRDTFDNAHYVAQICNRKNFTHVALVTSAYHLPRAYIYFSNTNLHITPVICDSKLDMRYSYYSFLPTFSNLANSTKAMRELLALAVLYITGSQ
ncbi:MAG: YdcF family protein [Spirochaetes bacterium]|nr:YdcF family protein [Spirochaetota bacterium]